MSKAAKTKVPVKKNKKTNGYNFPEKLPEGEVLKDIFKNEWVLGKPIGKGGFGEIYSANKVGNEAKTSPYAVKIEPQENGPLFVEKNFYIRYGSREDVEAWMKSKKLKILGMPTYYSTGTHNFDGTKYRYLVMERYGQDLWSLFLNNNKKFPPSTVYRIAIQTIDTLNYIHDKELVHGDIKGANLLLGITSGKENHVFLVDFGLTSKYTTKEFKFDPKKAHNGTIEYTSCDWHQGVPTRRGDLEILGYNLLQWLNSTLPWEKDLKNKDKVYEKKKQFMENIKSYMDEHFANVPQVMCDFFEYISKLKYDEAPNYEYCKQLFIKELNRMKVTVTGKLEFKTNKGKHKLMDIVKDESDEETPKKRRTPKPVKNTSTRKSPRKENCKEAVSLTPKSAYSGVSTRNQCTPINITPVNNQIESDEDIFFTPEEFNTSVKNSPLKNNTPKIKKSIKKITSTNKISWKDAPTVRAGRTLKAGEYIKNKPTKNK